MCGIIVYYGDAENSLNRVLAGMWAIVYRAPDSTGIGVAGSELEPLKIRKELGSVTRLIDRLIVSPVFDEAELRVVSMMDDDYKSHAGFIAENQKKLLLFEGFKPREASDLKWADLVSRENNMQIIPGTAGSPELQDYFSIDTPKKFRHMIRRLTREYDLPLVLLERLLKRGFEYRMKRFTQTGPLPVTPEDLLNEFLQIFDSYAHDEHPDQPKRTGYQTDQKNPYIRKYVWKCLKDMTVTLPSDYTNDGVAHLFRRLDSTVLAGSTQDPKQDDHIQQLFEALWVRQRPGTPVHWRSLYHTERLYNVYGLAAASVLTCFQQRFYIKRFKNHPSVKNMANTVEGTVHPHLLHCMAQPVIAQGRWAIQASISVKNAHPFIDEKKLRAVVLNGQFNSDTESRVQSYLTSVAGMKLRSENSTELFSQLWGHYFDTISATRKRYRIIDRQYRLGLEDISIGSHSLDHKIFKELKDKTRPHIDQISFVRAMDVMIQAGGQFAVCGISLVSKDRLFIGAHKRPVYVVKRRDTSDFMVVSDINAAIGLFSQSRIRNASIRLRKLMKEYSKKSVIVEPRFFDNQSQQSDYWFKKEKMAILEPFLVDIFSLDQERIFAKIQTRPGESDTLRDIEITDFSGKRRKDIIPETTHLTPITFKKDFGKSYYEEHLHEIPGLLNELLRRYTDQSLPVFDIKSRLLTRRFGRTLSSLNRVIIVSTGFSYEIGRIVEKNMERFFSGINIVVTTPLDIDNIESSINPDRNLVVMVSWSGTTSDMVDFADRLVRQNILMVGITEKPFSDLGLIVRKSAGVIPVYSGEEATVAPLKSAVCMMQVLDLFCLYIENIVSGNSGFVNQQISEMQGLPDAINQVLNSSRVNRFCKETSKSGARSVSHYIIDALHASGAANFGVLNLELNAWSSMGTAIDYSEQDAFIQHPPPKEDFICVTATNQDLLSAGITFMKGLKAAGIAFHAVTYEHPQVKQIQALADQTVVLPKVSDHLQPMIDIPFMTLLGFYFGLARGRLSDEMPRNLAKSVTAGRIKDGSSRTADILLEDLENKNSARVSPADAAGSNDLFWIRQSREKKERQYYKDLLTLSAVFRSPDPFAGMFGQTDRKSIEKISNRIFDYLADDGIIIFVPMDKHAESGCVNFMGLWAPLFDLPLQMEYPERIKGASSEDSLVVVVASRVPEPHLIREVENHALGDKVWIGPKVEPDSRTSDADWLGSYCFKNFELDCPNEHTYFALSHLFATVINEKWSTRAQIIFRHFEMLSPVVQAVLSDQPFRDQIRQAIAENKAYQKILFITGFKGNCTSWKYKFKPHSSRTLESETFGVSTYSRLVLVDPGFHDKYVMLESKENMVATYSKEMVDEWQKRFLNNVSPDDFLTQFSMPVQPDATLPFMVDDHWYLPVLKPDYDAAQDCLVIIDATSEALFDAALDELATFGSRYARIVVITQRGFCNDARMANLKKYPISHIIMVPGLEDHEGSSITLSDFMLPVIINMIGSAMKFIDLHPES